MVRLLPRGSNGSEIEFATQVSCHGVSSLSCFLFGTGYMVCYGIVNGTLHIGLLAPDDKCQILSG